MWVIANIPNQARSQRVGNDIPRNLANILILPGSMVVIGSLPKTPMLIQVAKDGAIVGKGEFDSLINGNGMKPAIGYPVWNKST
jgi:hypothetical protein